MGGKKHNYPKGTRKPGGPRPMAGRPPQMKDAIVISIRLPAAQLAWLKVQGKPGEVIRRLIDEAMKRDYK